MSLFVGLLLSLCFATASAAPTGNDRDAAREALQGPRLAQRGEAMPPTRAWFVGAWETRNVEFGRDVRIVWRLYEDGRLGYDFEVDGVATRGSDGVWEWRPPVMHETWLRADGRRESGHARIERIDDNTLRLIIADNGAAEYTGKVRIYRRIGPAQVSNAAFED